MIFLNWIHETDCGFPYNKMIVCLVLVIVILFLAAYIAKNTK